eukprot:scaffold175733_cov17-Tisochrysis_lutea.AAC.1
MNQLSSCDQVQLGPEMTFLFHLPLALVKTHSCCAMQLQGSMKVQAGLLSPAMTSFWPHIKESGWSCFLMQHSMDVVKGRQEKAKRPTAHFRL